MHRHSRLSGSAASIVAFVSLVALTTAFCVAAPLGSSVAHAAPPAPAPDASSSTVSFTNSTPVAISSVIASTVTSTISVSIGNTHLTHLGLTTSIAHTFPNDLDITLQSPLGTVVTVSTDNGGGNAGAFDGTSWDDAANPGGQVPYLTNGSNATGNGIVTDYQYASGAAAPNLTPEESFAAFAGENPNGTWTLTISDDLATDGGSLHAWSLAVTADRFAPSTSSTTVASTAPVAIPDNGVATSTIAVTGRPAYTCDVDVQTFLSHPTSGQLQFSVQSPSGRVVTLSSNNGGANADVFDGTVFDDAANPGGQVPYPQPSANNIVTDSAYTSGVVATSLTPEEPLDAFTGEDPNGTWTLTVADVAAGSAGSIVAWGLTLESCLAADVFHGLTPARLVDTRDGQTTADGQLQGIGAIGAGATLEVQIAGRGGVPAAGAGSVALNLTATEPSAASFLSVYPTGAAQPTSSSLNVVAGQTAANMVVVPLGNNGSVTVFNNNGSAHLVVDVLGWFPVGASFSGVSPARLLDTRPTGTTIDGAAQRTGALPAGGSVDLRVVDRGGVPAAGAGAVALNITATQPTTTSYLTVYPTGGARPTASTLNVAPGQTVANMVIVPIGADGKVTIVNNNGNTHVVVDVLGWFPVAATFTGLAPARLVDTRAAGTTIDGQSGGGGVVGPQATLSVPVRGRGGVPAGQGGGGAAGSVVLNVTITETTADTYVTVHPGGGARPTASNLNVRPGATVANMVIVPLGADGTVSIYHNAGNAHVVVDVLGWFPALGG